MTAEVCKTDGTFECALHRTDETDKDVYIDNMRNIKDDEVRQMKEN
jgi:hypothetical protein